MDGEILNQKQLEKKARKWTQLQTRRFHEKRKFGYQEAEKVEMPPVRKSFFYFFS